MCLQIMTFNFYIRILLCIAINVNLHFHRAKTDDVMRTEMVNSDWFNESKASNNVRLCYSAMGASASCVSTVLQLPVPVLSALHALVKYLTDFNLHKLLKLNR